MDQGGLKARMSKVSTVAAVGWMMLVAFAMVGDCAGHREGATAVMLLTAVMWVGVRIMKEGFEALDLLMDPKRDRNRPRSKGDDDGPPNLPPPNAPVT